MNRRYSAEEMAPVICEFVSQGKKVNITVTGNSMYPLFRNRLDSVVLEKCEKYKKNDIVFYKRENGQYILHRIIREDEKGFCMAGDNETEKEYPVSEKTIIAKVTEAKRGKKNVGFSGSFYKFYCFVWTNLFFMRKILLKIIKTLAKLKNIVYNNVE